MSHGGVIAGITSGHGGFFVSSLDSCAICAREIKDVVKGKQSYQPVLSRFSIDLAKAKSFFALSATELVRFQRLRLPPGHE